MRPRGAEGAHLCVEVREHLIPSPHLPGLAIGRLDVDLVELRRIISSKPGERWTMPRHTGEQLWRGRASRAGRPCPRAAHYPAPYAQVGRDNGGARPEPCSPRARRQRIATPDHNSREPRRAWLRGEDEEKWAVAAAQKLPAPLLRTANFPMSMPK